MKKTCKICWGLSALLVMVVAGMAYIFLNPGNVQKTDDGRSAIILAAGERDLVLGEMRAFLEGIETITASLAEDDMKTIAQTAQELGMASAGQVPVAMIAKLPSEFRTLAMATHKGFDELAREAQDMGDGKIVLSALGELINNCTTCHSAYRIDIDTSKGN